MFSVRIVTADHYVSHPISGLDALQSSQLKVPVIRIFGATPAGQKTCMHVHGVFPYIYVPYDGTQPWNTYLQQFAASLDKAINIAAGNSNANTKHVYKINLVSGISMYGYHHKEESFLKIYFYNPNVIKKVADLLLGGAVFNKVFQPHEAHIPYLLQMFIDYNLYGMNLLNVSHAKFRRCKSDDNINFKVQEDNESSQTSYRGGNSSGNVTLSQSWLDNDIRNCKWDVSMIPEDLLLANSIHRQSTCELEVDVVAADILNRKTNSNVGTNPGLDALWEDEKQRRRNRKESSQLQATPSQDRKDVNRAASEESLWSRLKTIIEFHQFHNQESLTNTNLVNPTSSPYLPNASVVEQHSFNSDGLSEKTIVFGDEESEEEEDENVAAVVNVDCVHQVVESSQSFKEDPSQSAGSDVTKLLASLLASQGSNLSSQDVLTNEDHDSILLSQPTAINTDEEEKEMSQVFSYDLNQQSDEQQLEGENLNLSEFGQSWDGSMVSDDENADADSMEACIPQFDGPIDEKPAEEQPKMRKRLGTRGPVTTSGNNPSPTVSESQPTNYPSYGSVYQNEPSYMPPNAGMQAYHQNPSNYPDYDRRWDSLPFREEMTGGVSAVDQQASHWNHGWSRSLHSPRGEPSGYPGGGSVHGNNGSYMTEGFSRPYPNQQPPPPPPLPPQSQPQQQVAPMSDSGGEQYPNPYPYDMGNMYSPDTYSRSRTSAEGGHTPDARNSPFAGHLSPSPGYSRDGFETSRSPVPLSGNVGSLQGSAGALYNQTPPLPHPDESQGSFHKLLTCSDSPKQTPSADISTHQSLQRSISRCSTHSSESMSMGASTTPDPFKNMAKPVVSEDTSLETFEKLPAMDKVDETAEGRSSVDSSNHPPSETGNASLTPLDSNSSSQNKKRVSSLNMSHEDLFGSPSLNSCADLSSDSFTSAEGSRHPSSVDPTNTGGYMATGYSKNSTHAQRCSSVTSEEEAPSYQSLTMPFTGNRSGNRSHSAIASLEQMVSNVGGYDMSGYDYPTYTNRTWQCASPQGPHNVSSLHSMPPGPGPNIPPGPNMSQGPTMPPTTNLPSGTNIPSAPNMPPNQTISQSPNIPSNQNINPGQNMSSGPNISVPGSTMPVGANMSPRSNLHPGQNMPPGHSLQGRSHTTGHSISPMSSGHTLTPHNIPTHSMQSGPNINMSQSQHMTQGRGITQGMSHNLHSSHGMAHNLTSHAHTMPPQGHNVHPSHNMASNPTLAPPPSHTMTTAPTTTQGHSMSSSHNMMQSHNLPQAHPMTPGHDRPHSYNMPDQGYQQQQQPDAVAHKQGRLALKKKRPDPESWSYSSNSYYPQQGRTWNHPPGPQGQNYGNPTYWNYMDSYPTTYQSYPSNPKVDQPGVCSVQKPHQLITPGMPMEKSKRGRKRSSFTMAKCTPAIPIDPQASRYTYTFHVPTPIYKRLKFLQKSSISEENAVCIVRMHPMDARRYSLLKIGRELVKVPKLEPRDIEKIQKEIKATGVYSACSFTGPGEQRAHLISKGGSHLPLTSDSIADVDSKQLPLGKRMLPLGSKAASKSAPSGFQLEYERMLLQNHPRVSEKTLKSDVKLPLVKGNERPRRMRMRTTAKRKRQSPVKLKDYTDHPFTMEGSIMSGLLSSDDEKFSPRSQLQSHSSPPAAGMQSQLSKTSDVQPDNPLSSKKTEGSLMPIRSTPHVRRSTRPFPKQEIVSSLMASPHIKTAGPGNYRIESLGRGTLPHTQQPPVPMCNSDPDPSCAPMQSSCINNTNKPVAPTNMQPMTCKDNKDGVTSQPESPEPPRKPLNSCKDQPGFQGCISSPSNSPPPPSGPSSWQSNNMMGSGVGQFSHLSANHNTQQQQQRKRKFCPDNGNTYKDAPTNFTALNFNGVYDHHLDDDYDDDDDDDDYVVDDDDDDNDDDDDDDDDDDSFMEKAGSNSMCCLVVNKRARRKSLVVKLEKLNLPSKSVKASEFLASHDTVRRRVCTGNKISRRMENVGWERIQLANKNKQRGRGLSLMSYSGSVGDGNGRLQMFTNHTEDLFYERPTIDCFQDEYLGVSITGMIDEAGETGLLMSMDDDSYSRITNTDSSSGEDATISTEEEFEVKSGGKNKRKRNLTPNQRLGVAFLTTRHRRKKALPLNHGKLMNSLSLLHQATLAKLTDTSTYTDTSDDFKKSYNDVMSKLAMFSPPVSEKGDTSPPQPLSPEENGVLSAMEGNPDEEGDGSFVLDSNDARSMLMCQTSVDSIYETPLSSVETQRFCESAKSPGLTSLGGSETEQQPPEPVLPATKQEELMESKQLPNSKKGEPPLEKSPYAVKTAVVKLIPRTRSGAKSKSDRKIENGNESETGHTMDPVNGQKFDEFGDVVVDMEHTVQNSVWLNSKDMLSFNPSPAHGSKPFTDCGSSSQDLSNSPTTSFGQSLRNSVPPAHTSSRLDMYSLSPPRGDNLLHGGAGFQEELNCDSPGSFYPLGNLAEGNAEEDERSLRNESAAPSDGAGSKRNPRMDKRAKVATTKPDWITTVHDEESRSGFADSEPSVRSGHFLLSLGDNQNLQARGHRQNQDLPNASTQQLSSVGNRQELGNESRENGGNCLSNQNKRDQSEGASSCPSDKVADKGVVLRPRDNPPSKDSICHTAASYGLSISQVTDPFCGRPEDISDTPRELGGRILTLQTHLLKDLTIFNSVLDGETLHNWRFILAANHGILPTAEDVNCINKLFIDPTVHCNLVGNRQRVLTPCLTPPARKHVASYKNPNSSSTLLAPADNSKQKEEQDSVVLSKDDSEKHPQNKGKDEDDSTQNLSLPRSPSPLPPTSPKTVYQSLAVQGSQDDSGIPDLSEQGSPLSKGFKIDCSPRNEYRMHSTPLRSNLLSVPAPVLTPIAVQERGTKSNQEPQPSTSKAKPEKSHLRRQLASKQMKQWTPGKGAETSQIEGPTPRNTFGFKVSQLDIQGTKSTVEVQHICTMSLEMHMQNRGKKIPDPEIDAIQAVFVAISEDKAPSNHHLFIIVVDPKAVKKNDTSHLSDGTLPVKGLLHHTVSPKDVQITYVSDELELISELEGLVKQWDPDIFVGYEIHKMSWGYLIQRAAQLNIELVSRISRIPGSKPSAFSSEDVDINLPGRIVLNLWRIMKYEVTLNIYTIENLVFHVLHQRIPRYSYQSLTTWFNHRTHLYRWRVVDYFLFRAKANLMLIDQLDIIGKTSEFARVFGIEFYHVLSRGSQYRVESMMLRIAKPLNFIAVSPSVHQRAKMRAPECIPLNLEPESRFYSHPVIVLDFQSLYPSIMIAYNYCFSTCLGRLENLSAAHEGPVEFGCTNLNIPPSLLKELENDVTISPNGCVFVKEHIRKGIISRMVEDILNTRIMVKKSMKKCKDKALHRMLNARQLGLKLIANVTYGYTGANFSGRMPCIEVGDSIVRKARETLENAIHLIEETPEWGAKVIYGDTDSVFVLLKGHSKESAIRLGQHMADVITANNPKPVKLKFEKVYLPCVLQTKKRYVGLMYETEDQKEPVFNAKGIETVRRDGCAAASKILERSLKILFASRDVSRVKDYVVQQCRKISTGKINLQDFVFAKEYRGLNAYRPAACVPALEIAKKLIRNDRRAEPQSGERVPYVIVYGEPGLPLIQLVRQPLEVLADPTLRLNVAYYITKQILPPLSRVFYLMGVNVFRWYSDMPKVIRYATPNTTDNKTTISHYFNTMTCLVCSNQSQENICCNCEAQPQMVAVTISNQLHHFQKIHHHLSQICHSCSGARDETVSCISLDCPILHQAHRAQENMNKVPTLQEILCNI